MTADEQLRQELLAEFEKEIEKYLDEVRACPMTPGSLEPIMTRAGQAMARLTHERLAKAASHEADFPPSGVSPLPGGAPEQPEKKAPPRRHGRR